VIHVRTLHLGPEELLVAATPEAEESVDAAGPAQAVDDAEARVRAAVPDLKDLIHLEPDLRRSVASGASTPQHG
jgi:hypothetical protein